MQLVVMLYDGALRFLNEARSAQACGDLRSRARALQRVAAIVAECQSTLDLERGGAMAATLDGLYSYISGRLLDVTVKRDDTAIEEIHKLMSTLRSAWAEAAVQTVVVAAAAQTGAVSPTLRAPGR
jgi:flagellar protein FliS